MHRRNPASNGGVFAFRLAASLHRDNAHKGLRAAMGCGIHSHHPPRAGQPTRGDQAMAEDREAMNVQGGISSKSILSIRVVVETVAVAAILWLASSVNQGNLAIARMQVQLTQVQSTLADVPGLTRQLAQVQTSQIEHDRRLNVLEADAVSRALHATGAGR